MESCARTHREYDVFVRNTKRSPSAADVSSKGRVEERSNCSTYVLHAQPTAARPEPICVST
eukprot:2963065-Pyramimonas_sp.AAC.1